LIAFFDAETGKDDGKLCRPLAVQNMSYRFSKDFLGRPSAKDIPTSRSKIGTFIACSNTEQGRQ
jgi:hypothetical protein